MKYQLIIISSLLMSLTRAWFGTGHLLVARIAQSILEDYEIYFDEYLDMLDLLRRSNATKTKDECDHPFTECATYADDLYNAEKHPDQNFQFHWHFVDTPLLDQGGNLSDFNFTVPKYNNTEAIPALGKWIKLEKGYNETYYYKTLMEHVATFDEGFSTALRLVIHYVGDVHQPLHSTTRVNHQYPEGDMGGNLFPLPNSLNELHAVWDSVLFEFDGYPVLPLNSSDWDKLSYNAERLNSMHINQIEQYEIDNLNPQAWATESFELAKNFVYKYAKENQTLGFDYLQVGRSIAERRIVLAGHRLAGLLLSLRESKPEEDGGKQSDEMQELDKEKIHEQIEGYIQKLIQEHQLQPKEQETVQDIGDSINEPEQEPLFLNQ